VRHRALRGSRARSGLSLLEMSAVFVFLGVLMLVMSGTLVGALKVQQSAANVFHSLAVQKQLANEFRGDVGQALAAPDKLDNESAGPDCVILRMDQDRHVIYRWKDSRVERTEVKDSRKSVRRLPAGDYWVKVAFARKGNERPMVSLRLIESRPPSDVKHIVEIAAALGGDRR